MQTFNQRISESLALLATIDPISQGAGTVTTGWVDMKDVKRLMAVVQTGVMGASGTVDAKLQQATDSSGTGAKDVANKAITQIVKASGDNKQAIINLADDELDVNNSFRFVRLSITVGTAASLIGGSLWGGMSFETADGFNQAAVVQVVP